MTIAGNVSTEFTRAISLFGHPMRLRYFNGSIATGDYDDAQTLTQSGADLWCSGVVNNVNTQVGNSWAMSADSQLLEQGILIQNDQKVYLNGSIATDKLWRIGIGSPVQNEYAFIDIGTKDNNLNGSMPFKTIYVRALPTGSLMGE